uniref:Coiled-coil domain-containing protein 84 n=1 Tax=Anthurium amnicola TaxID=1678845 RepID=A0A1D1YU10_9ARAE
MNPATSAEEQQRAGAAATVPFELCKVCNLNHNQGRKHRYFPNHVKALSRFLSRFQGKLSDLRFFLKNPSPLRPEHAARNRLWCVFCDADVSELGSAFVCSDAIYHLASSEHVKHLKHFLWKYGGGMDRVDSFSISEADLLKWEKKCEVLKVAAPILCDKDSGGPRSSKEMRCPLDLLGDLPELPMLILFVLVSFCHQWDCSTIRVSLMYKPLEAT